MLLMRTVRRTDGESMTDREHARSGSSSPATTR